MRIATACGRPMRSQTFCVEAVGELMTLVQEAAEHLFAVRVAEADREPRA